MFGKWVGTYVWIGWNANSNGKEIQGNVQVISINTLVYEKCAVNILVTEDLIVDCARGMPEVQEHWGWSWCIMVTFVKFKKKEIDHFARICRSKEDHERVYAHIDILTLVHYW